MTSCSLFSNESHADSVARPNGFNRIPSLTNVESLCLCALLDHKTDALLIPPDDMDPSSTCGASTEAAHKPDRDENTKEDDEVEQAGSSLIDKATSCSDVRASHDHDEIRSLSDGSSWGSQDDANHIHHDAWEVLNDEYAEDFGFDYATPGTENADELPNSFQILGTSADDPSIERHVLSPPMMDSLMSFLPESIGGQNFWLRYSLVRDGASLWTLTKYAHASENTILAIETSNGDVFGSFTSSPWRTNFGFYGSKPAFVWKLRHGRQTKCTSLFEQAQLESEIDVFMAHGHEEECIQVCRHDIMAVGGDKLYQAIAQPSLGTAENFGFALCMDSFLTRGTTSRCATFHSPSLCGQGDKTEIFDVVGLEVWTMTPCRDTKTAEHLELTKCFVVEESTRSLASSPTHQHSPNRSSRRVSSNTLDESQFYRRLGYSPGNINPEREFVVDLKGHNDV